jgi:hypothetical protein
VNVKNPRLAFTVTRPGLSLRLPFDERGMEICKGGTVRRLKWGKYVHLSIDPRHCGHLLFIETRTACIPSSSIPSSSFSTCPGLKAGYMQMHSIACPSDSPALNPSPSEPPEK